MSRCTLSWFGVVLPLILKYIRIKRLEICQFGLNKIRSKLKTISVQ